MNVCDGLTYAELRIARASELDIEAELIDLLAKKQDRLEREACAELSRALCHIDEWKRAGTYETKRAGLIEKVDGLLGKPSQLSQVAIDDMNKRWEPVENLFRGLRSPDPEERADFEALFEKVTDMSVSEAQAFVRPLKEAKAAGGRPKVNPPWRGAERALDRMRELGAGEALSIHAAALIAAQEEGSAMTSPENRAKTLAKHFNARMDLRK